MTEQFIRRLVSVIGTLIVLLAWLAGYFAGGRGWWWVGLGTLITYVIVHKLMEV